MKPVVTEITRVAPESILIIVTNPIEAMCHVSRDVSGFPRERIIGLSGVLDSARFSTFIPWS
jgi:malate dehydrogenase